MIPALNHDLQRRYLRNRSSNNNNTKNNNSNIIHSMLIMSQKENSSVNATDPTYQSLHNQKGTGFVYNWKPPWVHRSSFLLLRWFASIRAIHSTLPQNKNSKQVED